MPLIVEDGTGLSNANSWLTHEEAAEIHAALGNTLWPTDQAAGEALLLKAVIQVIVPKYSGRWRGVASFRGQSLPWPRHDYLDDEREYHRSPTIPHTVLQLQASVAYAFLTDPTRDRPVRRGVTIRSSKIGPITRVEQFDSKSSSVLVDTVSARIVRPLLERGSNGVEIVRS